MKKIFFAIYMLACCLSMSAQAQSLKDVDPASLPKGITINGDQLSINMKELLSDPSLKEAFIQSLNEKNAQDGVTSTISNIEFGGEEEAQETKKSGKLKAEAISDAIGLGHYTTYDYHYKSVDTNNQPITLSGRMYVPSRWQYNFTLSDVESSSAIGSFIGNVGKWFERITLITTITDLYRDYNATQIKWGVLCVHPTVTSNYEAPTGGNAPDKAFASQTSERCLVVCPDYLGYGYTKNKQHPYLIQDITARNCIDGYLAALEFAHTKVSKENWSDSFFTTIAGYSQGGSVALACTKYLQSGRVSADDLKKINLRETFCGDGPYSPVETVQQYLDWGNSGDTKYTHLAYPCVLPLIVQAAKQYYDKGCMHTVNVEDYFTKQFLATGIISDLDSKTVTTEDLNVKTANAGIYTMDQMMSEKMITKNEKTDSLEFNTESNEYNCLIRALEQADLTKGWVPEKPIYFFHFDGDLVVPYANVLPIKAKIESGEWPTAKFIDAQTAFSSLTNAWRIAIKTKSAPMSGLDRVSEWDHVNCGMLFYIWFMSGCPNGDSKWREAMN